MELWKIIAVAALVGIFMGFLAYNTFQGGDTYCQNIENDLRENMTFNGSIACYPPGVIEANISAPNRTELKCVCRRSYLGNQQTFAITVSK